MKGFLSLSRRTFPLFAVATLACGIAAADTIVATGVNASLGEYNVWINANGTDTNTYFAGVIEIQLTNSSGTVDRDTLCVDLFTDIYLGQSYGTTVYLPSQISPASTAAALERAAWLEDNALLPAQNPGAPSTLPSSDWVTTAAQGAGLQLAIWDIEVDGGDGLSSGEVQAATGSNPTDPTVLSWAETYESLSSGMTSNVAFVYENVDSSNGDPAQTLEGPEFQDNGPQPVPESSSFVLAGVALLALRPTARREL